MKKRYFLLNADCILVNGEQNSGIYDLTREDIIGLDPDVAAVLRLAEEGSPMDQIASLLSKDHGSVEETLKRVATHGLGRFYNRRLYIEKSKKGKRRRKGFFMAAPVIAKVFIELSCNCGLECSFCQAPKVNPCAMCSKPTAEYLDVGNLYTFLKRLLKMQCMSLVFHGGDPLAHEDNLFAMVEFCRAQGFKGQMFVITNGINLANGVIRLLGTYKVHPVIPFAGESGGLISENMLSSLAQGFQENGIEFTLTLVINSNNATSAERMRDFAKRLGAASVLETVIFDDSPNKSAKAVEALGKQIVRVSGDVFYHNAEYHPCLDGTLAVSADGRLLPCPFLTDEILGSIANPRVIDEVFETSAIDKYWGLSLSQVEGCKDCAFRYGCLDCRAVEKHLTASLYGKKICALSKWERT